MDRLSYLISNYAKGFEKTISKHENVLDNRIGKSNSNNSNSERNISRTSNQVPWDKLSHEERNRYLYG